MQAVIRWTIYFFTEIGSKSFELTLFGICFLELEQVKIENNFCFYSAIPDIFSHNT